MSSLDPVRDPVRAEEGIAVAPCVERRDCSLCPAHGAAWPGTAEQCLESHSHLGSCSWLLFISRYLILFRN